jgi:membrane-bound metal-dependent hydrolase YbcI (DUF457 family)
MERWIMDMVTLTFVVFILFTHYIGDYLCQTRKQGNNKHEDSLQLFYHVGTYTLVLIGMLMIGNFTNFANRFDVESILIYGGVNFVLHFITDFFTSRGVKRLWSTKQEYATFAVMGLDQFIHAFTLLATSSLLF